MPRPARSRVSPWIESLIQSYGDSEGTGTSSSGPLTAHVVAVGQMSRSQVQGHGEPTGLLFLSDGRVLIPAVLTASAWTRLQEQEDRESFTSLISTTVCIQDYKLQFHMAPEQTKCRFFLLVGELATSAAGPLKNNSPCCTSLPSVRLKICKMWRALLGQEDSQGSQCGFDLSDLLGEWQQDSVQAVVDDVREKLMVARRNCATNPQPSTSTFNPAVNITATSWDMDRVRYKGAKRFSVPIKQLLIPGSFQQQQRQLHVEGRMQNELSEPKNTGEQATPPADDEAEGLNEENQTSECVPEEESLLHENIVAEAMDSDIRSLSNPWDIFPRPCDTSSSSESSPERTQGTCHVPVISSTRLSVHASKESQQPLQSNREHSFIPPYQNPPPPGTNSTSTGLSSSSLPGLSEAAPLSPATHSSPTSQENGRSLNYENKISEEDKEESKSRAAKRKRSEFTAELLSVLVEEEEAVQMSSSPPSWLFDSQGGSKSAEGSVEQHGKTVKKQTPNVHSDGTPFSYSYKVARHDLLNLSRFCVSESLLHWAVKYLIVPKWTDNGQNT